MQTNFYYGTGRRKEAVARVRLFPGKGNIVINGKPSEEFFPRKALEDIIRKPLQITGTNNNFDIIANVSGGGNSGQAGAIRHGIARALVHADEGYRSPLKRAGLLTRDSRMKERHKYGFKKARKASQFSKR